MVDGEYLDSYDLINMYFEILSEEEIDIQAIEELDKEVAYTNIDYATGWDRKEQIIVEKINELIKAVKQINRKKEL